MKIQVIFYSMFGHIYRMAEAVAEGARSVDGAEVELYQVAELVPESVLEASGAKKARDAFSDIPLADPARLAEADAIIFGTPTRFGNACAQMRNFLDQTGSLFATNALVDKVGSVFTSTGTQHGGQETTILSFIVTLLHHGMIVVGVPYSEKGISRTDEMSGGTHYGASTICCSDGSRQPSENEIAVAKFQGRHVAEVTHALLKGSA